MVTRKNRVVKNDPPAKIKIANALRTLLKTKDFHSITTAELAGLAQANEALIYRYFGDKRGGLHDILGDYQKTMHEKIEANLEGLDGAGIRLEQIIRDTVDIYNQKRVIANIVLVKSRNFPGFFRKPNL